MKPVIPIEVLTYLLYLKPKRKEMAGLGNWGNPTFFKSGFRTPVILGTMPSKVPDFTTSGHHFDCASMQERETASQPNPSQLRCCTAAVS